MTSKTPPAKPPLPLPPPPEGKSLGELIQMLIDEGVYPTGPRRPRKLADVATSAGISEHSLLNIRTSPGAVPQLKTFNGILVAFFGKDPSHHPDWRAAMAQARERAAEAKRKKRGTHNASEEAGAHAQPSHGELPTADRDGLPVRVPIHFHGRDADLEAIHACLTKAPYRVALHGPHGIGKTVLAAAYLNRFQQHYHTTAWIDSATDADCEAGLTALGRRMSWCLSSDTPAQAAATVLRRLAEHDDHVLLVYDNATSPASVHRFLPNGAPRILITSNSPNWRSEAEPYLLAEWTIPTGAEFLQRRTGRHGDRRDAEALAAELGNYPIALELAASFCERRSLDFGQYRRRFAAAPLQHLESKLDIPSGYRRSIMTAFSMSIEAACEDHPGALTVLKFLSVLSPRPVPLWLTDKIADLFAEPEATSLRGDGVMDAIAILRNFSLLTLIQAYDPDWQYAKIHPIVKYAVLGAAQDQDKIRDVVIQALVDTYPIDTSGGAGIRGGALTPFVLALFFREGNVLPTFPDPSLERFIAHCCAGDANSSQNRYREAVPHLEIALELARALDHPEVNNSIRSRMMLLYATYKDAGLHDKARSLFLNWNSLLGS